MLVALAWEQHFVELNRQFVLCTRVILMVSCAVGVLELAGECLLQLYISSEYNPPVPFRGPAGCEAYDLFGLLHWAD